MNALLEIVLSNLAVAGLLALVAAISALWGRRPALTHGLWLLVLLKLITPPVWRTPLPWLPAVDEEAPICVAADLLNPAAHAARLAEAPPEPPAMAELIVTNAEELPADLDWLTPLAPAEELPVAEPAVEAISENALAAIPWLEVGLVAALIGSLVWLVVALGRLVRFQRLLRFTGTAPEDVQQIANELAEQLDVTCPQVRIMPGTLSPMLWPVGRAPLLLLPGELLKRLAPDQLATLLAHELAHYKRHDHWVRWLEVAVLSLYWWCPLVWWARRELRQAEEECCDAWVVAVMPESARAYALALVETLDFLSGASSALPPVASGIGHVRLLKRRLTMILRGKTPRHLTLTGLFALVGVGALLLPFMPILAQQPPTTPKAKVDNQAWSIQLQTGEWVEADEILLRAKEKPKGEEAALREKLEQLTQKRAELEDRMARERLALEEAIKAMRQALEERRGPNAPGEPGKPDAARRAGVPKPMGPSPGGWLTPGMPGGFAFKIQHGDMEKRLDQVERKLDALLWEIQGLRRDMAPGKGVRDRAGAPPQSEGAGGSPFQEIRKRPGGDTPEGAASPPGTLRPVPRGVGQPGAAPGATPPLDRSLNKPGSEKR